MLPVGVRPEVKQQARFDELSDHFKIGCFGGLNGHLDEFLPRMQLSAVKVQQAVPMVPLKVPAPVHIDQPEHEFCSTKQTPLVKSLSASNNRDVGKLITPCISLIQLSI